MTTFRMLFKAHWAAILLLAVLDVTVWAAKPISIAVLDFECTGQRTELRGLERAIREMLVTDLSNVGQMQLVERGRIQDVLKELKLAESGFVDPATAARFGKGVGADAVLVGSLVGKDGTIRIDARLVDVETGAIIQAEEITGKEANFFELEKTLTAKIVASFGIKLSAFEKTRMNGVHTKNLDAAIAFGMAQDCEEKGEIDRAKEFAESALKKDGQFKLALGLVKRIDAMVDRLSTAQFEKNCRQVAAIEWLLENAPVHVSDGQRVPMVLQIDDLLPRDGFSQETYQSILKEKGRAAALGYRLERVVLWALDPSFALRTPPSFTIDHSSDGFYLAPDKVEDLRDNADSREWVMPSPIFYAFETLVNWVGEPGIADVYQDLGLNEEYLILLDAFGRAQAFDAGRLRQASANLVSAKAKLKHSNNPAYLAMDIAETQNLLQKVDVIRKNIYACRVSVLCECAEFDKAVVAVAGFQREFPGESEIALALAQTLKESSDPSTFATLAKEAREKRVIALKARQRIADIKKEIEVSASKGCRQEKEQVRARIGAAIKSVRGEPDVRLWRKQFSDMGEKDFADLMAREAKFQEHYWGDNSPFSDLYHVPGCAHLQIVVTAENIGEGDNGGVEPSLFHSEAEAKAAGGNACPYCLGGKQPVE